MIPQVTLSSLHVFVGFIVLSQWRYLILVDYTIVDLYETTQDGIYIRFGLVRQLSIKSRRYLHPCGKVCRFWSISSLGVLNVFLESRIRSKIAGGKDDVVVVDWIKIIT